MKGKKMALPHYRRSGRLWYVSDGYIWDGLPEGCRAEMGRPRECSSKLSIFNPQDRAARATVRFYHVDRPPTGVELGIAGGEVETIELASLNEVPRRQSFWIAVESDAPVLPQACHEDYTFWDPVPDAMISVAPYPGPLRDETAWIYPDCFQGGSRSWYERETLTILNPRKRAVTAHVRYFLRNRDLGGEETVEIPGERVAALEVWERTPRLLGTENGPPVQILGDYAVRIDATGPVVTQSTRRARWKGYPSIAGARSTMAFPLRGEGHDLLYYPGGAVIDRDVLPRAGDTDHPLSQCDNTWNLLFVNNPDGEREAHATVAFHRPDGSRTVSRPLRIAPQKSILECLHGKPWLGMHTHIDEPFAMAVAADRPVVPEVTCAEFEMWSQVCPGAMSAVNLYPGPLKDERTWWLGIARAGGSDGINAEWSQTYHLFNPGGKAARVKLSFAGVGRPLAQSIDVGPGAVVRVDASEIEGLPPDRPFAVRADGSALFCAQVFVRAFTRGLPHTRSMYSIMGVPMRLGVGRPSHA